jgi:hypothetical protein
MPGSLRSWAPLSLRRWCGGTPDDIDAAMAKFTALAPAALKITGDGIAATVRARF